MATTSPHTRRPAGGFATARARLLFILDGCLLLAALALESPRGTGLFAHEWLGIFFSLAVVAHLLLNWQWIGQTLHKIFLPGSVRARVNATLNAALFVCMTFAIFSGFRISEIVLPIAGVQPSPLIPWHKVHKLFAMVSIAVVGLHLGLNWNWLAAVVRTRAFTGPLSTSKVGPHAWRQVTTVCRRLAIVILAFASVSVVCIGLVRSTGTPRSQPARRNRFAQTPEIKIIPQDTSAQILIVAAGVVLSRKVLRLRL